MDRRSLGNSKLKGKCFLLGWVIQREKSVFFSDGVVQPVSELKSTHEEADQSMLLHTLYSFEIDGAERVVIYANDTDVIVLCLYYAVTHLQDLGEILGSCRSRERFTHTPFSTTLGPSQCVSLP